MGAIVSANGLTAGLRGTESHELLYWLEPVGEAKLPGNPGQFSSWRDVSKLVAGADYEAPHYMGVSTS